MPSNKNITNHGNDLFSHFCKLKKFIRLDLKHPIFNDSVVAGCTFAQGSQSPLL